MLSSKEQGARGMAKVTTQSKNQTAQKKGSYKNMQSHKERPEDGGRQQRRSMARQKESLVANKAEREGRCGTQFDCRKKRLWYFLHEMLAA